MTTLGVFVAGLLLFSLGLRLSAFFSGAETGFYRISRLRLSIDSDAGDVVAQRLSWFVRNPGYFVATTLVGNNVANYLTTLGIGVGAVALVGTSQGWVEIVATLLVSPVVFVFGELLPKNLFYRAPMAMLRRAAVLFAWFYRVFLPVSLPIVVIVRWLERLSGSRERAGTLLGRNRLVQAITQGHQHGLLTDVQDRLAQGVLEAGTQSVRDAMTDNPRVLGIEATASREAVLDYAGRLGATHVIVRDGVAGPWIGYVRVVDLAIAEGGLERVLRPLTRLDSGTSKLDALALLRESGQVRGVVCDGETQLGIVTEQGLVEQLFRPAGAVPVDRR